MPANRIPTIFNPNYKRNGTKSYVWLMSKYGFNPNLEGPYFRAATLHNQEGKFHGKGLHVYPIHKRHAFGGHSKKHREPHEYHHHHHHSGGQQPPPDSTAPDPSSTDSSAAAPSATAPSSTAPATGSGTESSQISAQDVQTDSEYVCPVQIGTPAQTLMLDFDTGSSDLWVWSTELDQSTLQSGQQAGHNIFDPSKSSTFKKLQGYTWQIQYGDGSSASGDVGTDVVALGSVTIEQQAVELSTTLSQEFQQDSGDGLLGLAWPSINTIQPKPQPTPVASMIAQDDIPKSAELFTAYLGSWRDANDPDKGQSFYTFGEIDQDALNGQEPAYTAVDNSQGFWMFPSTSCTVNGKSVSRPANNKAIADTGTTLCLIDTATVQAIYQQIPGSKYDSTQQGYVFPTKTTAAELPDVALPCGNNLIHIQKEYLAFADAGNGMVFGGIQERGDNPFDILGDVWLKSAYVIFDQGNQRLGVVQRTEPTQNLAAPPAQQGGGGS